MPARAVEANQYPWAPLLAAFAALAALASPFSYTHRPGRSALHGPAGSGVDFSIPQNAFVCVLLEMGSLARDHVQRCNGPPRRLGGRTSPTRLPCTGLALIG